MPLYHHSGVCVESWVELDEQVSVSYEVDHHNDYATLLFGTRNEYVLKLSRANLGQVLELGSKAAAELDQNEQREHALGHHSAAQNDV